VRRGVTRCPCQPRFTRLAPAVARLDADHGFGQHAGRLAMDHAVATARREGVAAVGVHDSNFFGTGARFAEIAAKAGMIALVLSNSVPKVAAHGGHRPVLGTNPFAFGAPRGDDRSLLVDMSTAGLAGSTIREHLRDGTPLAPGLVIDAQGTPVTDPASAQSGTLLPAAGAKGFGLALMVEILSGVLTGAGMADEVGSLYEDLDRNGDSGHFFLVLDIRRWMRIEAFHARLEALFGTVRGSGPEGAVRLPGEMRWETYDESRAKGIRVQSQTIETLDAMADDLGVDRLTAPPKPAA